MSSSMSVRWLLEAFQFFSKISGKNIVIVPVMISYDRKFEASNLATEMVSGVKKDYTFYTSLSKIYSIDEDGLGQIYVKYLKPINIEEWLEK